MEGKLFQRFGSWIYNSGFTDSTRYRILIIFKGLLLQDIFFINTVYFLTIEHRDVVCHASSFAANSWIVHGFFPGHCKLVWVKS